MCCWNSLSDKKFFKTNDMRGQLLFQTLQKNFQQKFFMVQRQILLMDKRWLRYPKTAAAQALEGLQTPRGRKTG
jgi:hypothetical protein